GGGGGDPWLEADDEHTRPSQPRARLARGGRPLVEERLLPAPTPALERARRLVARFEQAVLLQQIEEGLHARPRVVGERGEQPLGVARAVEQGEHALEEGDDVGAGELEGAEVRAEDDSLARRGDAGRAAE